MEKINPHYTFLVKENPMWIREPYSEFPYQMIPVYSQMAYPIPSQMVPQQMNAHYPQVNPRYGQLAMSYPRFHQEYIPEHPFNPNMNINKQIAYNEENYLQEPNIYRTIPLTIKHK